MDALGKSQFETEMARWKFGYAGSLRLVDGRPLFAIECDYGPGLVYLWVEVNGNRHTIVYVGMAKGWLTKRCGQHERGFITSSSGLKHFQRLRESLSISNRFVVYARTSGKLRLHGEEVPAQYAEEQAFIRKFRPAWNLEYRKKTAGTAARRPLTDQERRTRRTGAGSLPPASSPVAPHLKPPSR